MNIHVSGSKEDHALWKLIADANGMSLGKFVATAVNVYWKKEIAEAAIFFATVGNKDCQDEKELVNGKK